MWASSPDRQCHARSGGSAQVPARSSGSRAGELRAHVPDHLEARRHVLQYFGDVLADLLHRRAAVGAGAGRGVFHRLARQAFGSGRRAGRSFCSGLAAGTAGVRASRLARLASSSSTRSSSWPIFASSFSEERPNCSRRSLAMRSLRCSISWSRSASFVWLSMIRRLSVSMSSGRSDALTHRESTNHFA